MYKSNKIKNIFKFLALSISPLIIMNNVTVEGAQLALEIGSIILKEFKKDEFPLMFNILETICNNKKLSINW